ncbi:MAG TPA: thioredoxin domain-containing protein [Thermoanaerobaculia bacterium]|nr:thioredoxin domain-containing protein [Thermoanaerobaculia bacterium]
MRKPAVLLALLALAPLVPAQAAPELTKAEIDRITATLLPPCPDPTQVRTEPLGMDLGGGLRATVVRVESENPWCNTQMLALGTRAETYFLGAPWLLGGGTGSTAQKIRQFAWQRMNDTVEARIESAPRKDGLLGATVEQKTEFGIVRLRGAVDPEGTIFIPGELHPLDANLAKNRLDRLGPVVEKAPWRGSRSAAVTVYEFSDFQCPSCKRTRDYATKVISEFGDKVRYVRVDMPLIGSHPWAFPAAVFGRAIWKQNPEAFWEYKNEVYESQEQLNAFTLEDFTRGFVRERGLDLARFDSDVASPTIREEILAGLGASRSLQINATPTFLVDGSQVVPGEDAKNLLEAVRKRIAD